MFISHFVDIKNNIVFYINLGGISMKMKQKAFYNQRMMWCLKHYFHEENQR